MGYLVQSFSGENNTGLMHSVITAWIKLYDERKQEAEMAEALHKSQTKQSNYKSRNKKSAGSMMNRAGQHVQNMLLLRCYHAWRMDARMDLPVAAPVVMALL